MKSLKSANLIKTLLIINFLFPINIYAVSTTYNPYPQGSSCSYLNSNDLSTVINYGVDSRIQGLDGSGESVYKKMWTTRGNGTTGWVRNPSVWTNRGTTTLDLTGASPWNSNMQYRGAGTLISPRHIMLANHYTVPNGTQIIFVDNNNNIVTRNIVDQMQISNNMYQDTQIALLDSDVPNTITYYPIIDISKYRETWKNALNSPLLTLDQEDKALVYDTKIFTERRVVSSDSEAEYGDIGIGSSTDSTRLSFFEGLIGGDSGNPAFLVIGDKLALVMVHLTPGGAPFASNWLDQINAAMSTLDNRQGVTSNYQTSTIDLSCFVSQTSQSASFSTTTYNFSINENSAYGTNVGQVSLATGTNQIFNFSSSTNIFGISTTTGQIYVASSSLINYESNNSYNYFVNSLNGDWYWPMSNATTTVNINVLNVNESPVFNQSQYSFTFDEGAMNGVNVGNVLAIDPDVGHSITYSIESGNNGLFSINSNSGMISILNKDLIDYDATSTHPLTIKALDNGSPSTYSTTTVYANISPVNHPKISFNNSATTTNDNIGVLYIPFDISYAYGKDININFGTLDGTAVSGNHFSMSTTTYKMISGQTHGLLPVNINYKNSISYDKLFFINILGADKAMTGTTSTMQVTIKNIIDSSLFPVIISNTSGSGGGGGGGSFVSSVSNQQNNSNIVSATTTTTKITLDKNNSAKALYVFNKDLSINNRNEDVRNLQKYLNSNGFIISKSGPGSKGNETNLFGPATKSALIKFQKSKGLPATGFFGPMTRGVIKVSI